jgi:capsular polysaccharide biosynthesis protein
MELIAIIRKNYQVLVYSVLAFLAVALVATFIQPLKYRAQAKVLVVQQFEKTADPYNASKMNEYLSGLLAKVVSSESFFSQTVKSGNNIDTGYFSGTRKQQMKLWGNIVQAKSTYDSGIITINIYHPDKAQAEALANATIYTLKTTNSFYHNIQNVDVRVIDSPSLSTLPVKPNIALNAIIGILFGLIFGLLYAYNKEQHKIFNKLKSIL